MKGIVPPGKELARRKYEELLQISKIKTKNLKRNG
jgi:hypothetical protein